DDVRRLLVGELDDVLAEIGLHGCHTRMLERLVEIDLLGGHRLRLDRHLHAAVTAQPEDDVAGLGTGRGPVHVPAQPLHVVGQLSQVDVELLERRLLDRTGLVTERITFGKAGERVFAKIDELGRRDREGLLEEPILERARRALLERDPEQLFAHARSSPARTWARCSARTRECRRESPPPICMRQPASHATTQSAPVRSTLSSFLPRIAEETSGNRTENEPPNPQHSSAPGSSTSSTPGTPRSSARGLRDSARPRSRWQES